MKNLRITTRPLTDGSLAHQVRFEAPHPYNGTFIKIVLEANDRKAAARLFDVLNQDVAYTETDVVS
jgi:hypothetical protein